MNRTAVLVPFIASVTITQRRAVAVRSSASLEVHVVDVQQSRVVPARPGVSHDPYWRFAFNGPGRCGLFALL